MMFIYAFALTNIVINFSLGAFASQESGYTAYPESTKSESMAVNFKMATMACDPRKWRCANNYALTFVNMHREANMLKPCEMGTEAMLQEARLHSIAMYLHGFELPKEATKVECGSNITAISVTRGEGSSNLAHTCLKKLVYSTQGIRNILLSNATETVLGVYVSKTGVVWCTQAFATGSKFSNFGRCSHAREESDMNIFPSPYAIHSPEIHLELHRSEDGHVFGQFQYSGPIDDRMN